MCLGRKGRGLLWIGETVGSWVVEFEHRIRPTRMKRGCWIGDQRQEAGDTEAGTRPMKSTIAAAKYRPADAQ